MNLAAIADALADQLGTIPGVRAYPRRVSNFATTTGDGSVAVMVVPGQPLVSFYENGTMTGGTVGGLGTVRYTLQARVPIVAEQQAQTRLYELASSGTGEARSVYDAIRPGDLPQPHPDGLWDDVYIVTATVVTEPGETTDYLGIDFAVEVLARRST